MKEGWPIQAEVTREALTAADTALDIKIKTIGRRRY